MALELLAPAKLNLALEVTGNRPDGYHEIVSLMQTIDLVDRLRIEAASVIELEITGEQRNVPEDERNLVYVAARALQKEAGRELGARIELEKRIKAGAGLGGGSSDAAAVLRGLDRLWGLDLGSERLSQIAARIGSDVAFFLYCGAALATGRGEQVEPLPDGEAQHYTLFLPDVEIDGKTKRMYSMLTPADFSDGKAAHRLADALRNGAPLPEDAFVNVFDAYVADAARIAEPMARGREAGVDVHACGSGPAFYARVALPDIPKGLVLSLDREFDVRAIACRSLDRASALAIKET